MIGYALAIKDERDHYLPEIIRAEKPVSLIPATAANLLSLAKTELQNSENFDEGGIHEPEGDLIHSVSEINKDSSDSEQSNDVDTFENSSAQPQMTVANNVGSTLRRQFIVPLSSEAIPHDTVFDGARFSSNELVQAESIGKELGVKLPSAQLAAIIRRAAELPIDPIVNESDIQSQHSKHVSVSDDFTPDKSGNGSGGIRSRHLLKSERKDDLRKNINRLANRLAHSTGSEYDAVHRRWIEEMNGKPNRTATEQELEDKLRWLENEIAKQYQRGKN